MPPVGGGEATGRRQHWEAVYQQKAPTEVSWYQSEPEMSLSLIEELGLAHDAPVLDVGGGTSTLVDSLVDRGFTDVSVLDLSKTALETSRRRLGDRPEAKWIQADVLEWRPQASIDLWHDRAVFHFLINPADQAKYFSVMRAALGPGGAVILGTFAAGGPESCSGLPVAHYGAAELASSLGGSFRIMATRREAHTTPSGAIQPFNWIAARRASDD